MNIKKIAIGVSTILVIGASSILPTFAATTIVVTPGDMALNIGDVVSDPTKWFFYNDETDVIDNTLGSFVLGPNTPPAGSDSVQISVVGTQRRNLATYQFSGTELSDITDLRFSTYNPSAGNGGSANRSGYLNFNVDFNGSDAWQRRLVFLPSANGTVSQDGWKEWDAINGGDALWTWSGFVSNGNKWPDNNTNEYRAWGEIVSAFPGIRIRVTDSWLGIRVGEPYADGYTENIDAFKFGTEQNGTTTFDFELIAPTPTATPTPNPFAIPAECQGIAGLGAPIIGTSKSETLNGTNGSDLIFAMGGSDKVVGNGGDDCIVGGPGSDKLLGNNGADVILGGPGADSIEGNNGTDTLYGQADADSLKGGGDNDTLIGGAGYDSARGEGQTDTCDAETELTCEL